MLHWIEPDFFFSTRKAAPVGAVYLAIFALCGFFISAKREAQRPFLERQLDSCAELTEIVGTLAATSTADEKSWNTNDAKFWAYFWGRRVLFEDTYLEDRIKQFGEILNVVENNRREFSDNRGVIENIREPALCVSHVCKAQVRSIWSAVPGLIRSPERNPTSIVRRWMRVT
jgi:hypothetical protein